MSIARGIRFSLPYLDPSIPLDRSHSELGPLVCFPSNSFLFRELQVKIPQYLLTAKEQMLTIHVENK
jgi:hypothetical protein